MTWLPRRHPSCTEYLVTTWRSSPPRTLNGWQAAPSFTHYLVGVPPPPPHTTLIACRRLSRTSIRCHATASPPHTSRLPLRWPPFFQHTTCLPRHRLSRTFLGCRAAAPPLAHYLLAVAVASPTLTLKGCSGVQSPRIYLCVRACALDGSGKPLCR